MTPARARVAAVALALAGAGGAARAQSLVHQKPAISVERLTPSPGHAAFLGADDPDVLPAGAWAFDASLSLASDPIVLRDPITGAAVTEPVRWRLGLDLGVARGLGSRYQVGLAVPLALQSGDRLRGIGLSERPLQRAVAGDARLYGTMRLAGAPGAPGMGATAGVVVVVPTGDDGDFAGEQGTVLEWHLAGGWRGPRAALALNAGARIRTHEVVLLSPSHPNGNELTGAVAGEVAVTPLGRLLGSPDRLWAVGEVVGVLGDSIGAGRRGPSPLEARGGARLRVTEAWSVTAAVGVGLTAAEVGSPAWRLVVSVTRDGAPRGDLDGDGVPDRLNRCPTAAEDRDGYQDDDGCPDGGRPRPAPAPMPAAPPMPAVPAVPPMPDLPPPMPAPDASASPDAPTPAVQPTP